jgi:REP element-mobilizing transposase RayT
MVYIAQLFCTAGFQPALGFPPAPMTQATRSRGYLPHLESRSPLYFVTFRLADSIPRSLLKQLQTERQAIQRAAQTNVNLAADLARISQLRTILRTAERCLDRGLGHCYMRDQQVAKIVVGAIKHFEGARYHLFAWCVMPNHVHAVFSTLGGHTLQTILHSWKSFSAEQCNRLLNRTGPFWQREYFDHLVRSADSLRKIIQYVKDNPQKAGLKNWPWVETGQYRHFVPPASSRPPRLSALPSR